MRQIVGKVMLELVTAAPEHAEIIFRWRNQPHTQKFNHISSRTIFELAEKLKKNSGELADEGHTVFQWMMRSDGSYLGLLSLEVQSWFDGIAELGYNMDASAQGKGHCSKAVALLLNKLFTESSIRRVVATAACENTASWKVLEKNGFLREGCFREHHVVNGTPLDFYSYAILKKDRI